jgi:hypothetical protein
LNICHECCCSKTLENSQKKKPYELCCILLFGCYVNIAKCYAVVCLLFEFVWMLIELVWSFKTMLLNPRVYVENPEFELVGPCTVPLAESQWEHFLTLTQNAQFK